MTPDIDVEKLFETHTVEEVKLELQKIRNNIERKKEDLRVMVGERYRDLIEAADTIQLMEASAAGVCKEVAAVQQLCSSLQHRGLIGFRTTPSQQHRAQTGAHETLVAAAQVKVVVVASARIWTMLERGDLLAATQLLLLTQHTHTALLLTRRSNQEDVVSRWPVLSRQWASVCQLPATISRLCRHTITSTTTSCPHHHQRVCEAVVSLLLLQGNSLSATLHSVLHLLQDSLLRPLMSREGHEISRTLISAFAERLVAALSLLHAVFASDGGQAASAVERLLQSVASGDGSSSAATPLPATLLEETEEFLQLLPPAVRSYRPRVRDDSATGGSRLKRGELEEAVGSWLEGVVEIAKHHLVHLLGNCPSLQATSAVRQSVWAALAGTHTEHWRQVLAGLGLGSEWCVWQRVVRDCLLEQAHSLLTQQLSDAVTRTLDDIQQLTQSIQHDEKVASEEGGGAVDFVWSEAPGDLPDKVGWLSAAQRTLEQAGGLAYKSYGYTARTQAICGALDGQLAALRHDLEHMRCQESEERYAGAYKDYEGLLELLQNSSAVGFSTLVQNIEDLAHRCCRASEDSTSSEIAVAEDDLEDEDSALLGGSSDEVWGRAGAGTRLLRPLQTVLVSLARLTLALTNICPNVQLCAIATALSSPDTVRRVSLGLPVDCPGGAGPGTWTTIKDAFEAANINLLKLFLGTLTASLQTSLEQHLTQPLQRDLTATLLSSMALCDCVEVCDEDGSGAVEGGAPVVSSLRVPAQPTPALSRALHALCRRLSSTTPHTLNRTFSSSVPGAVCRAVLAAYRDVVPLAVSNQQLALHLLFDLKFVATVAMPVTDVDKSVSAELAALQQRLEASVDPFDLSVVQPHLSTRVRAAANRAQVILGCIYVRDRQHPATKLASGAAAALPLVPVVDIPRFSNVPLPKSAASATLPLAAPVYGGPALHDSLSQSAAPATASKRSSEQQQRSSTVLAANAASTSTAAGARSASSIFSAALNSSWFGGAATK